MIGQIKGRILDRWDTGVVVDVNGLGYEIHMPSSCAAKFPPSEQDVTIYTHLVWREDTLSLYGFESKDGRDMFRLLLQVSGVGPRVAMNVLSMLGPDELIEILAKGENKRLQSIHGVGKKTAARLCVDLRERAKGMLEGRTARYTDIALMSKGKENIYNDALSALINLGYKKGEASVAIRNIMKEYKDVELSLEDVVRAALKTLVKEREPRK